MRNRDLSFDHYVLMEGLQKRCLDEIKFDSIVLTYLDTVGNTSSSHERITPVRFRTVLKSDRFWIDGESSQIWELVENDIVARINCNYLLQ